MYVLPFLMIIRTGDWLVSGSQDLSLKIWDWKSRYLIRERERERERSKAALGLFLPKQAIKFQFARRVLMDLGVRRSGSQDDGYGAPIRYCFL